MMNIQAHWSVPPTIVEVVRPHLSASKKAGIVTRRITRADIPDARKDAVELVNPADWKRSGAYWIH
jgi:hypothetical protein